MDIKEICVKFIPQDQHRYATVGDYQIDENGVLQVRISNMEKLTHKMAVLIHELTEWTLVQAEGKLTNEDIDNFDFEFEKRRERGEVGKHDEPGMAEDCPYRHQHAYATCAEMTVIAGAFETWTEYEEKINELFE
jgi:hypothetical protein